MKMHHMLMFLAVLFIALMVPIFFDLSNLNDAQSKSNAASDKLESSLQDAIAQVSKWQNGSFKTKEARQSTVNTFYKTYDSLYNTRTLADKEGAKYHIPCIVMTDWDGFYINYTHWYAGADGLSYDTDITTEKQTWSQTYGKYTVQYQLDDVVSVINMTDGSQTKNEYSKVYAALGSPSVLNYMSTKDSFENEKNNIVIGTIDDSINYYINTHNTVYNTKGANYAVVLPQTDNNGAQELMTHPNVIGMVQQMETSGVAGSGSINYTDAYAFVACDYCNEILYYIQKDSSDGQLYYHESTCSKLTDFSSPGTMSQCAARGANPDNCIR